MILFSLVNYKIMAICMINDILITIYKILTCFLNAHSYLEEHRKSPAIYWTKIHKSFLSC